MNEYERFFEELSRRRWQMDQERMTMEYEQRQSADGCFLLLHALKTENDLDGITPPPCHVKHSGNRVYVQWENEHALCHILVNTMYSGEYIETLTPPNVANWKTSKCPVRWDNNKLVYGEKVTCESEKQQG